MPTYKQVINRTVKQYTQLTSGIKWKSMNGASVDSDSVNTALAAFTDGVPTLTDKIIIVGKKKSLLSAVLSLFQTSLEAVFQPKKASTDLYVTQSQVDLIATIGDKINKSETLTATEIQLLISNLVDSSPSTLDTLNELAAALGDDPNFATTITTLIGTKVSAVAGYSLTKNDLTDILKAAYDDAVSKKHTHTNSAKLDLIEEAFTTALLTKLNGLSNYVLTKAAIESLLIGEITSHSHAGISARCGFAAYGSGTIIPQITWVNPDFGTEIEDTHNAFNSSVFIVPIGKSGIWEINAAYAFAAVNSGSIYVVGVAKNGGTITDLIGRGTAGGIVGSSTICGAGGALRLYLVAGDQIRLAVYCANATSGYSATPGYCSFSAYLLR